MNYENTMKKGCCPECNFKGTILAGDEIVAFGEEYCGNTKCLCHAAPQPPITTGWEEAEKRRIFDEGVQFGRIQERTSIAAKVEGMKIPVREDVDGPYRLKTDVVHNSTLEEIRTLLIQLQDQQQSV